MLHLKMKKIFICMMGGLISMLSCGTKAPEGELLSVEYVRNEMSSVPNYEGHAERATDGTFLLKAMKEGHGSLFQKQLSKEEMSQLRQIILEEKMYNYKEHYRPPFRVLDGYQWYFNARFSDGSSIYSSGSNAKPRGEGLQRIRDCMMRLIADADSVVEAHDDDL